MCFRGATKKNDKIEAIQYSLPPIGHSSLFCNIVSNMTKLKWISVILREDDVDENTKGPTFLSDELRYIKWENFPTSPFPDSFEPMNLVTLKLSGSLQEELWTGYKHLPHLKVLILQKMKNLISTPDFDGLSCLQNLTLEGCLELKEIHSSLGNHNSLEYLSVLNCPKLRMFPTFYEMGKLETLEIKLCHKSLEFPEIKTNLKCLLKLSLNSVGIDTLLSSINGRCANLLSLELVSCYSNNKVNFDALQNSDEFTLNKQRCLKRFILYDLKMQRDFDPMQYKYRLVSHSQEVVGSSPVLDKWGRFKSRIRTCVSLPFRNRNYDLKMPNQDYQLNYQLADKFDSRIYFYRRPLSKWLWLVFPKLTHNIQQLDLSGCHLKDGEIPSHIGELCNLQELHLGRNDFTRLDFSLLKLNELILLNLNECKQLVELPKLPLSAAILKADFCESLTTVGYFYTNPKWLCRVSLMKGGVITDGIRLLESMLQGDAIEGHSMLLQLEGLNIAKGFTPPLLRGRCRLKLPENWYNNFCGFLMCAVVTYDFDLRKSEYLISMVSNSEDDVVWEQSDNDKITLITYISFASLMHTAWWNDTYKELLFSINDLPWEGGAHSVCSGFRVTLVARKHGTGLPISESVECFYSKYTPNIDILQDSPYALKIWFNNCQDRLLLKLRCD
ncbi:hypothetical protein QVD17_16230 [Tagetes erecta]|uniref:C-JID domain-containing protein n=1 Tax=Tagetes erecta TaxID=13708 RepID=A0AAD8KRB7_TARER|nr:hypothetical protein QVD17_16230 [Tagetes erecta]